MSEYKKFVIIGMGAFGKAIARTLKDLNADITIIDKKLSIIEDLKKEGFEHAVQLDSTNEDALSQFVTADDLVVLSMGKSFEDNILSIGILMKFGVTKIYTRAIKEIQMKIFDKMDVVETLFPEKQHGQETAIKLFYDGIQFVKEFAPGIYLGEFKIPKKYCNKTIIELAIRQKYDINIIALKESNESDGTIKTIYSTNFGNVLLKENDTLIAVGTKKSISSFLENEG
ncbi:MAG: TrkA family potassium uptake protein [Candidatus Marinimicrobia bacterium]|nr:TrkA family potassium uptake protein [Candidatus Neomarinimicrobiota bacterium]